MKSFHISLFIVFAAVAFRPQQIPFAENKYSKTPRAARETKKKTFFFAGFMKTKTRFKSVSNNIILFITLLPVLGFVFQLRERKRNFADHATDRKQAVTSFRARTCPGRRG